MLAKPFLLNGFVRAPAGDGCRKPSHAQGVGLGPTGFHPHACALRLPGPSHSGVCNVVLCVVT